MSDYAGVGRGNVKQITNVIISSFIFKGKSHFDNLLVKMAFLINIRFNQLKIRYISSASVRYMNFRDNK